MSYNFPVSNAAAVVFKLLVSTTAEAVVNLKAVSKTVYKQPF